MKKYVIIVTRCSVEKNPRRFFQLSAAKGYNPELLFSNLCGSGSVPKYYELGARTVESCIIPFPLSCMSCTISWLNGSLMHTNLLQPSFLFQECVGFFFTRFLATNIWLRLLSWFLLFYLLTARSKILFRRHCKRK